MVSRTASGRGFTIVELLIGLVLLSILITIAAPAFNEVLAVQRLRAATNELRLSISLARSEAVKRNVATGLTLQRRGSDWSEGWCVIDPDSSSTACSDPSAGSGYAASNYLNEVFLQDDVTVARDDSPTSASLTFNNWGRTAGCPRFEFTTTASGSTCTLCLAATLDGRVVVAAEECPSGCLGIQADSNAWSEACN